MSTYKLLSSLLPKFYHYEWVKYRQYTKFYEVTIEEQNIDVGLNYNYSPRQQWMCKIIVLTNKLQNCKLFNIITSLPFIIGLLGWMSETDRHVLITADWYHLWQLGRTSTVSVHIFAGFGEPCWVGGTVSELYRRMLPCSCEFAWLLYYPFLEVGQELLRLLKHINVVVVEQI
jgi:hypothetical protein